MPGKSIIEQVEEERTRRPEFQRRLEAWKARGYIVARLVKVLDRDVRTMETTFNEFENDIRRLAELQIRLNRMDVLGFPSEVLAIRQGLNDPDAAGELEHLAVELESKVAARREEERKKASEQARLEKERRMGSYRQRIASWADKGYSVKRLEGLLEDPASEPAGIERKLSELESDIQKLLDLRGRLEGVKASASEGELKQLDALLLDPDALAEASQKLEAVSKRFYERKSEEGKRAELSARLEEYRQKGYKVSRLEGAPQEPLPEAEAAFKSYADDIDALFRLWDRLRLLDRSLFPEDWEKVRALMADPDQVPAVQKAVEELERRQGDLLARRVEEDRRLAASGRALVKEVHEKMRAGVPDYLPLGFFIRSGKWEPALSADGSSARAEVRAGMLARESAVVACALSNGITKPQLASEAEQARAAGQFVARCHVMVRAPPEMVQLARTFLHPNLSVYIHDLSRDALAYNEDDLKTKVYAGWFLRGTAPSGLREAIKLVSDKHGIFTRTVLEQKLGLQRREMDEMLREWMGRNEVIAVSKIRDEYSFMD